MGWRFITNQIPASVHLANVKGRSAPIAAANRVAVHQRAVNVKKKLVAVQRKVREIT